MAGEEQLSAQQRSKIRRLSEPRELAADEEGGELNVVPFLDIIMNVMIFVLATVSVNFIAMIDAPPPKQSSRKMPSQQQDLEQLQLTVAILDDGFTVLGKGTQFKMTDSGSCTEGMPANKVTLPRLTDEDPDVPPPPPAWMADFAKAYDYAHLTSCVRSLKCGAEPKTCNADGDCNTSCDKQSKTCNDCDGKFATERSVTITTGNKTPQQVLIKTIDAVRKQGGFELFPEINFGVPSNR
jgi:biopolymer transport protein ExbD